LGELRRYTDTDANAKVLGRLADLLHGRRDRDGADGLADETHVPGQVSVRRARAEPSPIALIKQVVLPGAIQPVSHAVPKEPVQVFLFFSSRLGCLGSLAVSVILTLILLAVFHVL
jgi:hypothetical protein